MFNCMNNIISIDIFNLTKQYLFVQKNYLNLIAQYKKRTRIHTDQADRHGYSYKIYLR